jgi:hypothetical protein
LTGVFAREAAGGWRALPRALRWAGCFFAGVFLRTAVFCMSKSEPLPSTRRD